MVFFGYIASWFDLHEGFATLLTILQSYFVGSQGQFDGAVVLCNFQWWGILHLWQGPLCHKKYYLVVWFFFSFVQIGLTWLQYCRLGRLTSNQSIKVDKKALIRNRYNQISHPALNTKQERAPTIKTALKTEFFVVYPTQGVFKLCKPCNKVIIPPAKQSFRGIYCFQRVWNSDLLSTFKVFPQ